MSAYRVAGGTLILAAVTIGVGCASSSRSSSSPPDTRNDVQREPSPDALSARRDSIKGTDNDSIAALTHRTSRYSQDMEPLIDSRGKVPAASPSAAPQTLPPAPAPAPSAGSPSIVQWENSTGLKIDTAPQPSAATQQPALSNPAPSLAIPQTAGPTPQIASATLKPKEDFPTLAVEGHEVPQGAHNPSVANTTDAIQKRIETKVRDFPKDSAAHLDYELSLFLQDRATPDLASLASLSAEDREVLTVLMDGLSNFRTILRNDSNMLLSRKVRPLIEMSDRLRSQSELTLPTVALCKSVKGFGLYEPIDADHIVAGKETRAIVYCEVANFASQLDDKQQWQTKLTHEMVLYNEANGMRVWRKPVEPITDSCRNRRHDFYTFSIVQLPATLPVGQYVLKVTVVDQQANRVAESSLPVTVVAQ